MPFTEILASMQETSHGLAALETRVRTLTATSNNDCTLVLLSGQEGANEHEASSMGMPAGSDKGSEGAVVVRLPPANHANEVGAMHCPRFMHCVCKCYK